jgi:hypothetical protein
MDPIGILTLSLRQLQLIALGSSFVRSAIHLSSCEQQNGQRAWKQPSDLGSIEPL